MCEREKGCLMKGSLSNAAVCVCVHVRVCICVRVSERERGHWMKVPVFNVALCMLMCVCVCESERVRKRRFDKIFVNFSFFEGITSPKRMAEKEETTGLSRRRVKILNQI